MKPAAQFKSFSHSHLLNLDTYSVADIETILTLAQQYADQPNKQFDALKNATVLTLFFEDSTRTLVSFTLAAHKLGAKSINLPIEHSSLKKGESLEDMALTLNAMRPDAIVVRHPTNGPHVFAKYMDTPVLNAGNGMEAHPTQALADALTVRQKKSTIKGLKIVLCGDITHSRVAMSNTKLFSKLGATIILTGPEPYLPASVDSTNIVIEKDFNAALKDADVVMMLRIQKERMSQADLIDGNKYFSSYGLTTEKLQHAKPDVLVMHPGPMNRGTEIADDVADGPHSVILDQVANGVPVRMACLQLLIGGASA